MDEDFLLNNDQGSVDQIGTQQVAANTGEFAEIFAQTYAKQ